MDRIAEIKEREAKATKGPWSHIGVTDRCGTYVDSFHGDIADLYTLTARSGDVPVEFDNARANATFIAHARSDIPWLLAEVERLREALQAANDAIGLGDGEDNILELLACLMPMDDKPIRRACRLATAALKSQSSPTPATSTEPLTFIYRNYKGEVAQRRVMPICIWFGMTEWHPTPQWLLKAHDLDKDQERDFAVTDITPATRERELALKPFLRCVPYLEGRGDDEITSVEIECGDAETDEIKQRGIAAGVPAEAFLPGRSTLCVSVDGLKVKHWRALKAAFNASEPSHD